MRRWDLAWAWVWVWVRLLQLSRCDAALNSSRPHPHIHPAHTASAAPAARLPHKWRFDGIRNASLPQPRGQTLERHQAKLRELEQRREVIELVLLGDSITHQWEKPENARVWQRYFGAYQTLNVGVGGDRTEHVLWRIAHGELAGLQAKVVVIMIGTNNAVWYQPEHTFAGVQAIVHEVLSRIPRSQVLLLAVFPRGHYPDDPLRLTNDAVNKKLASHFGKEGAGHNDRVVYLDIAPTFLDNYGSLLEGIMPDGLHCNSKGYELWAETMKPTLDRMMGISAVV